MIRKDHFISTIFNCNTKKKKTSRKVTKRVLKILNHAIMINWYWYIEFFGNNKSK